MMAMSTPTVATMTSWANEEWRDIPGYEGRYQASNLGRIRSVDHYVTRFFPGKILTPRIRKEGYWSVRLSGTSPKDVHRLVALAFLGQPTEPNLQVRHLDGDRLNPRADNLAWGSQSENEMDKYRYNGRHGKLYPDEVKDIRHRANVLGERIQDIAKDYGVNVETARQAAKGVTFSWLK